MMALNLFLPLLFSCMLLDLVDAAATTGPAVCVLDGKTYHEGENFRPNPCTYCTCSEEGAVCAVADCQQPSCVDYVQDPNECCLLCPNGQNCRAPDGRIIPYGEDVPLTTSKLTCRCQQSGFSINQEAVCVPRDN